MKTDSVASDRGPRPTELKYGSEAAAKLGLPTLEALLLTMKGDTVTAYGTVCQILNRKSDLTESDFLSKNLPNRLQWLRQEIGEAAPKHGVLDPREKLAWLVCLKAWPALKNTVQNHDAAGAVAMAGAPTILQFWAELSRLQDLTVFANVPDAQVLRLSDIQQSLPSLENCDEAVLMICREDKSKGSQPSWTPLVGLWLRRQADGQLLPDENPQLVINQGEFFDNDTGEARGSLEADGIQHWIAFKEPTDTASVGPVDAADAAYAAAKPTQEQAPRGWAQFYARWDRLTSHWLEGSDGLAGLCVALRGAGAPAFSLKLINSKDAKSSQHAARLEAAAKDLNSDKFQLLKATLDQLVAPTPRHELRLSDMDHSLFLGHMDTCKNDKRSQAFPLDPTQRMAAMTVSGLAFSKESELLPINGPPGTGKTSFLRAALASIWVRSALNKAPHPPVVYGIAATNQAVSNMIEAFGAIRSTVPDGPAYPWLADLPSYGWFFPSKKAAEDRPDLMQLQWDDKSRNPYSPSGSASLFGQRKIQDHEATLLARAKEALLLKDATPTLELVTDAAYKQLNDAHEELLHRQKENMTALRNAADAWRNAQGQQAQMRACEQDLARLRPENRAHSKHSALHQIALETTQLLLQQETRLHVGWRALVPKLLRHWLWERGFADLVVLREKSRVALSALNRSLETDLPSLELTVKQLGLQAATWMKTLEVNQAQMGDADVLLAMQKQALQERADAIIHLFRLAELSPKRDEPKSADASKFGGLRHHLLRQLARLARSQRGENLEAYSEWIHQLEAPLDNEIRVKLFHWAARYWECRWVAAELKAVAKPDADRVQRLMMLSVIIVATTHKVLKLGSERTADLLIMDEAGQCLPEIAAACITFAKNAAFVGDVLQLQPVANVSAPMQEAIERRFCPANMQLPAAVKPLQGSAMKVAQLAARCTSGVDPGVTLLFHYRCVPEIVGYCNELLYQGRIRNARLEPRMRQLAWMPSMSWVDVKGVPTRDEGSWNNTSEVEAIVNWLIAERVRLTSSQLPSGELKTYALSDIVAIVTPLKPQAALLREALEKVFGVEEISKMVIGTVHKLQGAERPVVLFSLVQSHPTNQRLMADRDGGMLMNVAVSRARDAFVVFADRNTLKPAPNDALAETSTAEAALRPIAFLGRYLRKHGARLYPSTLVIVEAPGKVKMIEASLGINVAVIATSGTLRSASLASNGLAWSESPSKWLDALAEHAGLVREVFIATDDDLAGELIGMHAADDVARIFASSPSPARSVVVRRMRFSDMTKESLGISYRSAGTNFDSQRLAAAIVREFANLIDMRVYLEAGASMSTYSSAQVRDAVAWLGEYRQQRDGVAAVESHEVWCTLRAANGDAMEGFVTTDQGSLAEPLRMDRQAARELADRLLDSPNIVPMTKRSVMQQPGLYPANTTARVLAMAVDETRLDIELVQSHLNALYLQGAAPEMGDQ